MKTESEEILFDNLVAFSILPKKPIDFIKPSTATPNAKNLLFLVAKNTGAFNVTDFLYGTDGQIIQILGDGFTTLVYGAKISTNTGASKLLKSSVLYSFTFYKGTWYESVDDTVPGGAGEANTSSNNGLTGVGLVLAKAGVNLPFKSITAGTNVTLTDDAANKSVIISVPTGGVGPTGATGATGKDGLSIPGLDGKKGNDSFIPGNQGIQGIQGVIGNIGNTGLTGKDGLTIPGLDGRKGNDSFIPGSQGIQGVQGVQGIQGIAGVNGIIGKDGAPGIDGKRGLDSYIPGPKGDTGLTGNTGNTGLAGRDGITIPGLDGRKGLDSYIPGVQGIQGIQGNVGNTGASGRDGLTIPGLDGKKGSESFVPGPQGNQGIQGIAGTNGSNGLNGISIPGMDGRIGRESFIPGPTGTKGDTGAGGASDIKTAEVDFDNPAKNEFIATILDAAILSTNQIMMSQSYEAATDRNADENEFAHFIAIAGQIVNGVSFKAIFKTLNDQKELQGKFKVNYLLG